MDHQDVAASLVHAAKNRLQLLQPRFDQLQSHKDESVQALGRDICRQVDEVNRQLVLMLSLYRLEGEAQLNVEPLFIADELEICWARANDERVSVLCDGELEAYADRRLLQAVLGDALHNALGYCENGVRMDASAREGGVLIRILDDGPKKPQSTSDGVGVGLWLANKIAEAHINHNHKGYAKHSFDAELGSCFELFLP